MGAFFTVEILTMNIDPGWFGQIEREWKMLRQGDPSLNPEKFFRHVLSANKAGFLSAESLAAVANGPAHQRPPWGTAPRAAAPRASGR